MTRLRISACLLCALILSVLAVPSPAYAKSDAKDVIGGLIEKGDLERARSKAKEYLSKDPNDIDAIMMQGNIILNEYLNTQGSLAAFANTDESIYEQSIGYLGEPVKTVPRDVAEKVAALWKRCLTLDNSRDDIHMGLCYLYSMALMKKELLERLPKIKASLPRIKNLYYNMGDYARMFEARNHPDDCFEVYEAILKLYPDVSGLASDVAGVYFRHGRMREGLKHMDAALRKKGADEMVYANGVLIFTILGRYDQARDAFKGLSGVKKNKEWQVYDGLLDYLRGNSGWKKKLASYVAGPEAGEDSRSLAGFLLSRDNKDDLDSYRRSVDLAKESSIQILLHARARNRFPKSFEPGYRYAEMLVYYKNYDAALPVLREILGGTFTLTKDEREPVNFHYAWALQDSGNTQEADRVWKELLGSENFYMQSAAAYFLGKNAFERGAREEAVSYWKKVSDKAEKSKYATLSWNRLKWSEGAK